MPRHLLNFFTPQIRNLICGWHLFESWMRQRIYCLTMDIVIWLIKLKELLLVALITFLYQLWPLFKGGANLSKYSHVFNLVCLKARKPKQRFWVTPFKNLFFTLATLLFSFKESNMSMEKISGRNIPRLLH